VVEQLPEKCRLVFSYKRDHHMTTPEIAHKMDISEKTVEFHLTKAIKTLRNALKMIPVFLPTHLFSKKVSF
jgi:RNA polymerase sigma-70 factor (ECF subfamily)